MPTTIEQYREAKNSYLKLRTQAKKELIARFHEVPNEMLQIQRELLEDFGEKVPLPSKGKKPRPVKKAAAPVVPTAPVSAKVLAIQKQLELQKKKLAGVKESGKPTKTVEDRIYELEDELRLAQGN
jgi:hypothetical protein